MGTPIWRPSNPALVEQRESGAYELGEIITCTKVYRGPYSLCLSSASPKGALGTGALAGYLVSNCKVVKEQNGIGRLTVVWSNSSGSAPGGGTTVLPADTFGLSPLEINPRIEKHPNYDILTDSERENVKTAFDGGTDTLRDQAETLVATDTTSWELLSKLRQGLETYYMAGFKYTYTFHSWSQPTITRGGFIQAPGGPLAGQFTGLSCLRVGDEMEFTGSYFKVTRTWLCGPGGHWDPDIYA